MQHGIYLDNATMTEMAGDITLTDVYGTSHALTVDNSSYVYEVSGNIVVNSSSSLTSSTINTGLLIDGNNLSSSQLTQKLFGDDDTTSTVDIFSGTITMTSTTTSLRGIEVEGSYASSTYNGGNTLGVLTEDSVITLTSTSGSVYGVRNDYGYIDEMNGTISVTTGGSYTAAYYSMGTTGSITGTLTSTNTASGYNRTIWNASYGSTGATIESINATVKAVSTSGEAIAVYNLGKIGSMDGTYSGTSVTGNVWTLYNYYYNAISLGVIGTVEGSYSAYSQSGYAYAIYNKSQITSIDADITSIADSYSAYGVFNTSSTASIGSVSGTINVTASATAMGIYNASSASMGSINAEIKAYSSSGTSYGIYLGSGTTMGDVSGSINVQTDTGGAIGMILWGTSSIGQLDADITATANKSGDAYGIYVTADRTLSFGEGTSITATSAEGDAYSLYSVASSLTIDATDTLNLVGSISVDDGDGSLTIASGSVALDAASTITASNISIASGAAINDINVALTATSTSDDDIAIDLSGTMGNVTGSISATAEDGNATGILINAEASIGTIGADITATTTGSGTAYGVYLEDASSLSFAEGASITATSEAGDAYSIYSEADSLTINAADTLSLVGSIAFAEGAGSLTIASGTVSLDADSTITASNMTIAAGAGTSDVNVVITATSTSDAAIGINLSGTMGNVTGSISATAGDGNATAILINEDGNITSIGADITASTTGTGTAYGIYLEDAGTLSFSEGARVTSTSSDGTAYSLYSAGDSLSISASGTLNLVGDVSVGEGEGSFSITSGDINLSSGSIIEASSLTISSTASLALIIVDNNTISSSADDGALTVVNEGSITLSAGFSVTDGDSYAISSDTSLDFNDLGDVTAYGGTIDGNDFIVGEAQTIYLDDDTSNGVTLQEDNARIVVTTNTESETESEDSTTIVMNFSTTGIDDEESSKTITVSAVTTVTKEDEISFTTTTEGTTATVVTELDQSFAEYVEEITGSDYTIEVAEAYHFDVDGLDAAAGDSVEVIFLVGEGYEDATITVYHLDDTATSWDDATLITDFTYDGEYLTAYTKGFSTISYIIVSSADVDVIPEPSTATLGLLALAALCAKRRRSRCAPVRSEESGVRS